MIGKDIFDILRNDEKVSSIVGTRIYPNNAGENVMPLCIYELDNLNVLSTYDIGRMNDCDIELRVACFAETYLQCQELAAMVIRCLDHYVGGRIYGVFFTNTNEQNIVDAELDEISYYVNEVTFKVFFKPVDENTGYTESKGEVFQTT